jgi:aryl-alcohol dehydrogenase-like predicted oxidoreductase
MVPRPLGRTGISVSPIGLGTVKLGRNTDVKYPGGFALPGDDEVDTLLMTAITSRITLIDTAPAYGESETRLGSRLRKLRGSVVICTKAGETYQDGRSTFDFSPAAIRASLESSLARLSTDHVDILLLHSDGRDVANLRLALPALRELKTEGKTRAIGISAKTQEGILEAIATLDVVMAPFSAADPSLKMALEMAHDAGLGVLAVKGLDSGRAADPAGAVRFVLRQTFVDCLVVGTLSVQHLLDAVEAAASVTGAPA